MTFTWKIAIPVGLIAIITIAIFTTLKPGTPIGTTNQSLTKNTLTSVPTNESVNLLTTQSAADDFNIIADELNGITEAELTTFNDALNEVDMLAYDGQELINLEQIYDTSSF